MLGMEVSGGDCGVGVIVIFRFFGKGIGGFNTLYSISACDGITDKFDFALWKVWWEYQVFPFVKQKAFEFRLTMESLYYIHDSHSMNRIV